jgi:hypothetical protein
MLQSFNPKYMLLWRVVNIAFWSALSTEQYLSVLILGLLCWPLNRMLCLPELYYSTEILFRIWLCLTEFDWCGSLDTVVSMGMRRPMHLQEQDQVLLLWGRSLVFCWHLRVSNGGSGSGILNHTAPHGAWRLLVLSRECGWKSPIQAWRYLLRLPRFKLGILVGLITGHCPLNKHLHNMGLRDDPICIACGMEDESAFHLLCNCPSLISLRVRKFSKPILSVEEYEGRLRLHCCNLRLQVADSLWLLDSFILMNISSFCTVQLCLSISLFLIFQFFICVVQIGPDLWPACGDLISPTFNPPSIL